MSDATYTLSQAQLDHMAAVYELGGVNPKSGTLKYAMMDDGTNSGRKRLTLYAMKGFTNAVRASKNISVIEMTSQVLGGAVAVTAKAKIEDTGRTDMAMAAISIEGKSGRGVENAIASAQTKASRRVTIQIAGLDILDESEIPDNTVALETSSVPLSEIGQPVPESISQTPGKDVTNLQEIAADAIKTIEAKTKFQVQVPAHVGDTVELLHPVEGAPSVMVKLPNPAAGLPLVTENLASPNAPKPGRTRKPRAKANADAVAQAKDEAAVSQSAILPTSPIPAVTVDMLAPETKAAVESAVKAPAKKAKESPTLVGNMPSAEQMKKYVDRLTEYRTKILPEGDMVPSFGMAINKKLREFVKIITGVEDATKMTVEQWDKTFGILDGYLKERGPKGLVEIIEFNLFSEKEGTAAA